MPAVRKYSVMIAGHRTSVSLEPEFYAELRRLATDEKTSVSELITKIDADRTGGLSSALRLYVLAALKREIKAKISG